MVVENVRVKSCRVDEPNENDKYQIVFAVDDKKAQKKLKKAIDDDWEENKPKGAKKPDNMAYFISETSDEYPEPDEDTGKLLFIASQNAEITLKSGATKEKYVPVFNSNGDEYDRDDLPSIGAGTTANLIVSTYTYAVKGNRGTKLNFEKMQILDLVEYSGGESFANEKKKKKKKFGEDEAEGNEKKDKKKKKKKNK